jgi:CO/xanthine dehydrogenase Mo-binding subunit
MSDNTSILGSSPLRKEGRAKVLGAAQYIDDQSLPGMWFGATIRSTIARGRIRSITFSPDIEWAKFCIVRASDIPGENTIIHLTKDHPCLAAVEVNHPAEPILLLAHPNKTALIAAARGVHIDYDELPGVFTIEESETAVESSDVDRIIWPGSDQGGTANCFKQYCMYTGEADATEDGIAAAFENADFIVEDEYQTGAQEQLYIENNGVIAECFRTPTGAIESVCVRGSMQCPSSICPKRSVA